jgi:CheY-like chemotaxis protein
MSEDTRERAFEPFFTTKEAGRGSGLGLSQVQGFMAQSGGEVVLESEPGRGTSVALYLPACADATAARAPQLEAVERVLIVEDEPDLMEVAAELFRTIGYEVLTAAGGAQALALLAHGPAVQVLFSDVVMPGMSGVELARAVRARHPAVRVVLTSGYPPAALRARQVESDDFPLISKPYRLSDILRCLR